jgi:anti-sigma factor RsiW
MNVVRLDPEGHARVQSLLPWYVTGRLDDAERAEVDAHLAGCARCRTELALERQLHAAHAGEQPPPADPRVEHGWSALRRRVLQPSKPAPRPRRFAFVWWRWALGAQFAVITLLVGGLGWLSHETAPYRGLGAPGTAAANAVVMFSPETTEAQIRVALKSVDARLVGGPTATQAWLLALPVADAGALAKLRLQPGVTLAESLAAGDGR